MKKEKTFVTDTTIRIILPGEDHRKVSETVKKYLETVMRMGMPSFRYTEMYVLNPTALEVRDINGK